MTNGTPKALFTEQASKGIPKSMSFLKIICILLIFFNYSLPFFFCAFIPKAMIKQKNSDSGFNNQSENVRSN